MFVSSFCSTLLIWVLVSFPSQLVPCRFFFISHNTTFIAAWIFFMLLKYPVSSWIILITSVLNSASDRLAISLSLSCIFSAALNCSFIWAIFFLVSACLLHSKGLSVRCSPGQGNPLRCVVLYVGEGSKREQCCLLCSLQVFSHFLGYPQANWAFLVLIPGWVGLCRL